MASPKISSLIFLLSFLALLMVVFPSGANADLTTSIITTARPTPVSSILSSVSSTVSSTFSSSISATASYSISSKIAEDTTNNTTRPSVAQPDAWGSYMCLGVNFTGACAWQNFGQWTPGFCVNIIGGPINSFGPDLGVTCTLWTEQHCNSSTTFTMQYPGSKDLNESAKVYSDKHFVWESHRCSWTGFAGQGQSGVAALDV